MSGNYPPSQPPSGGYPPPPPGGYPPPPPGGYPPPGGGYPPPGSYYGGPPPPGGYGAPPPKKGNTWLWVLGGCFTLIVIGIIGFLVVSYFAYQKAKQVAKDSGFDTKLIQEKPALAAAKAIVAMDPDLQLVSSDDEKGTLTVRNKKTGEVITVNADDASKGKLSFKQNGKDLGSLEVHTDNPSLEVKTSDASAKFGAGIADSVPTWIPNYPGAAVQWDYSIYDKAKGAHSAAFHFLTTDDPEKVVAFYSNALKASGLTVTTSALQNNDAKSGFLTAVQEAGNRNCNVGVTPTGSSNQVSVVFSGND